MQHVLPIIAILRGIQPSEIIDTCEALVSSGITLIEVPLNSPEPFVSIEKAATHFAGRADIGAGTVLTLEDVQRLNDVGGKFVVSPDTNSAVIEKTASLGMASYPGCMTPTEAFAAIRAGATGLKFFPGELVGPNGIKAMRAVLPKDMPVYAVGGAGPDNFKEYIDAGATGFGLGSYLYKAGRSMQDIKQCAERAVAAYKEATHV